MRPLPAQQALGFGDGDGDDAGATLDLRHWPPGGPMLALAWGDLVRDFLASDTGRTLSARMVEALNAGKTIFPAVSYTHLTLPTNREV